MEFDSKTTLGTALISASSSALFSLKVKPQSQLQTFLLEELDLRKMGVADSPIIKYAAHIRGCGSLEEQLAGVDRRPVNNSPDHQLPAVGRQLTQNVAHRVPTVVVVAGEEPVEPPQLRGVKSLLLEGIQVELCQHQQVVDHVVQIFCHRPLGGVGLVSISNSGKGPLVCNTAL